MIAACILILAIITLAGISVVKMSATEGEIVRNAEIYERNFYTSQAGLINALENPNLWLTPAFLTATATDIKQGGSMDMSLQDASGNPLGSTRVCWRTIFQGTTSTDFYALPSPFTAEDVAFVNDLPSQPHRAPPPVGSGFSATDFEIRRFGVTVITERGRIQSGTYKIFNKY